LTFEGVSATSTGCVNAILLAGGLASGGRQAAKELLRVYWKRMSDLTSYSIVAPSFIDRMFLMHLFELGRELADAWLSANFDRIGVETTSDLKCRYFSSVSSSCR
jgi:hypothetical protein